MLSGLIERFDAACDGFARRLVLVRPGQWTWGAFDRCLDHPLGPVPGSQGLAVRTTDTVIHTWDLARAVGDVGRGPALGSRDPLTQ